MSKPKPTISDQLTASNILQNLIDNYEAQHRDEIPEGVQIVLNRFYKRLIKADERLLQPQPKRTRKPQPELFGSESAMNPQPIAYVNSMPRTGKDKR